MKVLIVTESYFGNTVRVGEAIAAGLQSRGVDVTVVDAASAPPPGSVDLVMVGAPTHYRGLPSPTSRDQAETRGGRRVTAGVAEWLEKIPRSAGTHAWAFDTVSNTGFFAGSAAKAIGKRLRAKSFDVVGRMSFVITGTGTPPPGTELARARQWGATLAG